MQSPPPRPSQTYYGQPEQEGDIGLMYHDGQQLTAKVLSGSPLSPNARLTDQSRTVSRLLSPLSADDIPEIRGLAAQYAAPGKAKTKPAIPGECFLSLRIAESSAKLLLLTH